MPQSFVEEDEEECHKTKLMHKNKEKPNNGIQIMKTQFNDAKQL